MDIYKPFWLREWSISANKDSHQIERKGEEER
jgi:hypothetical protein